MRLYRQSKPECWEDVFERMAADLRPLAAGRSSVPPAEGIVVEISAGELLDKISILEIKAERLRDPAKRANVLRELAMLRDAQGRYLPMSEPLVRLAALLREVNAQLWDVEDALRTCEGQGTFGDEFVQLARSVYRLNDRRADLKRQINDACGSRLREEKSYGS
jgi:hypothetical protein